LNTQSATTTITREVTVAGGVFAPGHLGELTQYLPFELVDDVLARTRTAQRRLRDLPSRAGVYFVLALGMFPQLGYLRVWGKLTAGLAGLNLPRPSEKALRDLRRRIGPAPLKALFEIVAGPLGQPHTPGVRFGGLRTVAFDGCNSLHIPDTDCNRSWLGKIRYRMGLAGYPTLRLMTLAETAPERCWAQPSGRPPTGTRHTWHAGCCRCSARACWCCWTGGSTPTRSWPTSPAPGRCCWPGPRPPATPPSPRTCPTGPTRPGSTIWTCA
jgi:hypothetical protein